MNNALDIEEHNEHHFYFRLRLPGFHWAWGSITFPFMTLSLCFWIVFEYPCFIPSYDRVEQVWFSLQMLGNVLANSEFSLFLVFGENLWSHFCTQLAHFQVFSMNFQHCVSANGKLLRNHSHSQSTIYTHQLLDSIDVAISPANHQPARSLIVLTFFSTFSESFVPFKSMSSTGADKVVGQIKKFNLMDV